MDATHIDPHHHIGDTLLFENDRVRVWSLTLEPGEESAVHEHPLDYVMVCIEGDRIAGHATPGQDKPYGDMGRDIVDFPTHPGQTVFLEAGVTETAVNTGETRYKNILVELKD